jgi:hypothetical protein
VRRGVHAVDVAYAAPTGKRRRTCLTAPECAG